MVISADVETRMLEKSYTDEVQLMSLGNGSYLTRSAHTKPGVFYVTTSDSCGCLATAHCKHIARVRAESGPGPLVKMVGNIECLECRNCGVLTWRGSVVFDSDPNAAYCYECKSLVAAA